LKIIDAAKVAFSCLPKQHTATFAYLFQYKFSNMKNLTILTLLLAFFTACNNDQKAVDALLKETETLHDEAMKDMAEMNRSAREIKEFMFSATMTPEQNAAYTETLAKMGQAENDMMDWMKGFKAPAKDAPAKESMDYLTQQKERIQKNHADIKAAIEAGKNLLGK
jgi:DNA-binding ferritin-like protein (Dps family)